MSTRKTNTPSALVNCQCHSCNGSGFQGSDAKAAFCSVCGGKGILQRPSAETADCQRCKGEGEVPESVSGKPGHFRKVPCPACTGTGRLPDPDVEYHPQPTAPAPDDNSIEARLARIEARLSTLEEQVKS